MTTGDGAPTRQFGALLRERRLRLGLTQDELSARSGVSSRSISILESGLRRPRMSSVAQFADALDLDTDTRAQWLLVARGQCDEPAPPEKTMSDDAEAPAAHTSRLDVRPARRSRPTARSLPVAAVLTITALLAVAALSGDSGRLIPAPGHQSAPTAHGTTSRPDFAVQVASDDIPLGDPSTVGADLQVLKPVPRGDALVVTVALTGAGKGPVTVTDTAANRYRLAGEADPDGRHELLLFVVLDARSLGALDTITARWPRATIDHVTVDAFPNVTGAGPWGAAEVPEHGSDSQRFAVRDLLLLCPAGDLLFTAVNTSNGSDVELNSNWRTLAGPQQPSPQLTTAYRTITAEADRCEISGFAHGRFQSIALLLHQSPRP
ncbi:MAG: helix-turn-helix transcriptional regulator [Streptomyces sp.]|nr:helix-turn-helix transcriptional regulator [Streptomyces sp.]